MVVDIETFGNYVGGTDLFDKVRSRHAPLDVARGVWRSKSKKPLIAVSPSIHQLILSKAPNESRDLAHARGPKSAACQAGFAGQRASVRETAKPTCVSDREGHSKYSMQAANKRFLLACLVATLIGVFAMLLLNL
jgi:hypothetical protein